MTARLRAGCPAIVAGPTMTRSGRRLARAALRLGALAAALPGASAVTLAHRLPILAGLSPASALSQTAELWRMTLEKPAAFHQAWLACATMPWQLWSLWARAWPDAGRPDLALRIAAAGLEGARQALVPIHAAADRNARRLRRRSRRAAGR
jgi:hypothetical protein